MGDKIIDLLNLMRGPDKGTPGLHIVKIDTAAPNPVTLHFEGTKLALDLDIFEIPPSCYPLRVGDRLLVYPLIGTGVSQRWGAVDKLNGGPIYMGTMESSSSVKIDGMDAAVEAAAPPYVAVANTASSGYLVSGDVRALQAGDRVSVAATYDNGVKYVILNKY